MKPYIAVAIFLSLTSPSIAHDSKAIANSLRGDNRRSDWFMNIHARQGAWCCDLTDAAHIDEDHVKQIDNTWYVFIGSPAHWVPVPADRIVNTPSIDGEPYLFMALTPLEGSPDGIRCFVPPIHGY